MILGKIDLQEAAELDFEVEVFGTAEKASDIRFVIEGEGFDIICRCQEEKGSIKVRVPKLKGILPAGVYESRLEVIVGGKIFVPLRESIEFNPLVEFEVKTKGKREIKEGVKVKVTTETTGNVGLNEHINTAMSMGYDVVQFGDFNVLKRNGMYAGLVSGSGVVKSDKEYGTLHDMVENLSE
jgi:hypothetical protein